MQIRPLHALALAALISPIAVGQTLQQDTRPIPGLVRHEMISMGALPDAATHFLTSVSLDGGDYVLNLRPDSIRGDGFQVLVPRDGRLVPYPTPPITTVRGEVEGYEGSFVLGSITPEGFSAEIHLGDGRAYGVQPETDFRPGAAPRSLHVSYALEDEYTEEIYSCGTEELLNRYRNDFQVAPHQRHGGTSRVTGNVIFDIACDADFEFYQLNGSSVAATVADMEKVLYRMSNIYEREVDIEVEVTTLVVRDNAADPYTSSNSSTLLNQFRSEWASDPDLVNNVRRDLAELFTGRDLDGSTIGVAWLGRVCNSPGGLPYSVVQSRFTTGLASRICLSAHEVGHNWNASHCDGQSNCDIMCSGLGGCVGTCNSFGTSSTNSITNHKNTRTCLETQQDPIVGSLLEEFNGASLDVLVWAYDDGGAVNGNGVNEPTAANSLNLNAASADLYENDDVRTGYIDLSGASSASVSYFVQHIGVEAGEELIVDYLSSAPSWTELDRVTSDGVDETSFVFREIPIPANGLIEEFRLRFRTEVNATNDNWYIDNVAVGTFRDITFQTSGSPIVISATPNDNLGDSGGTTPYMRTYNDGTTVNLSAPSTSGGLDFVDWFVDGVAQGASENFNYVVGDHATVEAVYGNLYTLDIRARAANGTVTVNVTPNDLNGFGNGIVPFSRDFLEGTMVTLSVPDRANGRLFDSWIVDGVAQPAGQTGLTISVSSNSLIQAQYRGHKNRSGTQAP